MELDRIIRYSLEIGHSKGWLRVGVPIYLAIYLSISLSLCVFLVTVSSLEVIAIIDKDPMPDDAQPEKKRKAHKVNM